MAFTKTSTNIFTCPAWEEFGWQKHGFGTRLADPFPALTLRQVHSADVWVAGDFGDREKEGDALTTNELGRAIGVRSADCVPILLLDRRTRAVAGVHAGWRGTAACIAKQAIEKMRSVYGTRTDDLQVAIGPCIRACCYEVSEDVAAHFQAASLERKKNQKPRLDLAMANRKQILEAGVRESHMYDSGLCTACDAELFYSYRREAANPGRMTSCICRIS